MIFPRAKSQSISTGFFKIKNTLTVACKSKDLLDAFDFLNLTLDTVHGIKCKLCEKDADIEIVNTDISAEAQMLRFPLYATHEQYLAFILAPHLQYAEPEPMPETGMVE